jgi:hypothetical protein
MATQEVLATVIAANKALQRRTNELNLRAGKNLFPVMSSSEREMWIQNKLFGAVSVATIPDAEQLRFPELDQSLVQQVLIENPDTIELLGRSLPVQYSSGDYPPTVILEGEGMDCTPYVWLGLPDEGVTLPSGRSVVINCRLGWNGSISEKDIPVLKVKIRNYLNQKQWNSWPEANRPAIVLPDPYAENPEVSEIITAQYGQCVVEGIPLFAYGTSVVMSYRYHSSDPWFEGRWFQTKEEAVVAQAAAKTKLEEIQVELEAAREKKVALEAVKSSYERIIALDFSGFTEEQSELAARKHAWVNNYYYALSGMNTEQLREMVPEAETISTEVEATITALAKQREEAEAAKLAYQQAETAAGRQLFNFGGHFRFMGMTGQSQYWVVCPDGSLRNPDSISYRKRYTEEGEKHWDVVEPRELALSWWKSITADPHQFVVSKMPVSGLTLEQLQTVEQLQREITSWHKGGEVGLGWNLHLTKKAAAEVIKEEQKDQPQPQTSGEVDLSALLNKWKH